MKQQKSHSEGQDNKLALIIACTYTDRVGKKNYKKLLIVLNVHVFWNPQYF